MLRRLQSPTKVEPASEAGQNAPEMGRLDRNKLKKLLYSENGKKGFRIFRETRR